MADQAPPTGSRDWVADQAKPGALAHIWQTIDQLRHQLGSMHLDADEAARLEDQLTRLITVVHNRTR